MQLIRSMSGWPSSCTGAISSELPNRSITDLITLAVFPMSSSARRTIENARPWTTLFTGLLEAAMPLCRTPEERLFFQQAIVDQFVAWPTRNEPSSAAQFMDQCLERLRFEGNTQLFPEEELPPVLQEFQLRLNEIKLSRMQRMIYRIRRRARMGRLIYPRSHMRRILYQIRHLAGLKLGRLLGGV